MTLLVLHDFSYREKARSEFVANYDRIFTSGRFFDGEYTEQLEIAISAAKKMRYAIAVNSGSSALYSLARYAQLAYGTTHAQLTDYTFDGVYANLTHAGYQLYRLPTNANGLAYHNDHDNALTLEIVTGLLGQNTLRLPSCPYLIHDAAQNWINATLTQGLGAALSFDPTKNLGSHGNGGMVLTNCSITAQSIAHLTRRRLDQTLAGKVGYEPLNMRISELEAADLLTQLPYLKGWQDERVALARCFDAVLGEAALIRDYSTDDVQKYAIKTRDAHRAQAIAYELKIETKVLYPNQITTPLLQLPLYPGINAELAQERYAALYSALDNAGLISYSS